MSKLESKADAVLQKDLEYISQAFLWPKELKHKSILVTGATGLVGSALIRALACMNRCQNLGMKILAFVRSEDTARKVFGDLLERADIFLACGDITEPVNIELPVDFIIHTASVTSSKIFVTQPVETLMVAINGTKNMLELARRKAVKGMVYVSSMEAYGITDPSLGFVHEKDLGYIDVLNVRSSYSEGKRACECLCSAYCSEFEVPVKIARLAQTFGAGVNRNDNRAFAQFTKSCMAGDDIVLHTPGLSMGNYCYTADAVLGLLTILVRGENAQAYSVVNESTSMQIRDVAQLVSDVLTDGRSKVVFDIPEDTLQYGYAPDVPMRLSGEKLRRLGWAPSVDLPEMFRRLALSFRAQE